MDRSAYLAQALQALGQPAQAAPDPLVSSQQMAQIGKDRRAFEAANPGQSYMAHGFQQMGQNIMQAPQRLMAAPGNAAQGFGALAQQLGIGGPPKTAPY